MKLFREKTTLEDTQCREVIKSLCNWPIVSMKTLQLVNELGSSINIGDEREVEVLAEGVYKLRLVLERSGPAKHNSAMHLPQWAKPKQAGWIIVVGDTTSDRILNTTSVIGSHSVRSTAKLDLRMPATR
uniref:SEC63 domain-containing protein n=1 Tax=Caenorhabditis japonica TaxID=281687 RepID=A0A8R1IHM9_CAEJA